MPAFETITTPHQEVSCDGGGGPLGHPRVFLHILSETGSVVCPYCSRTYILRSAEGHSSHSHY